MSAITLILASLSLLLCACTVHPFTYRDATREVASLGGSIMTKSKSESAYLEKPDGTKMSYTVSGKNETSVPNTLIGAELATGLSEIQAGVTNTTTAAGVSTAKISAGKAVKINASDNALKAAQIEAAAVPQ